MIAGAQDCQPSKHVYVVYSDCWCTGLSTIKAYIYIVYSDCWCTGLSTIIKACSNCDYIQRVTRSTILDTHQCRIYSAVYRNDPHTRLASAVWPVAPSSCCSIWIHKAAAAGLLPCRNRADASFIIATSSAPACTHPHSQPVSVVVGSH